MTEAAHAVLELSDVAGDGEEQVTVYIEEVMEDGDTVQAYTEGQEISVEELQQVCMYQEREVCIEKVMQRVILCRLTLRDGRCLFRSYNRVVLIRKCTQIAIANPIRMLGTRSHYSHYTQSVSDHEFGATNHHFRVFFGGGFFEKYVHPFSEKGTPSLGSPASTVI